MIFDLRVVTGLDDDRYKAGSKPESNPVNKVIAVKTRITFKSVNLK
jgi:hypothetical protein